MTAAYWGAIVLEFAPSVLLRISTVWLTVAEFGCSVCVLWILEVCDSSGRSEFCCFVCLFLFSVSRWRSKQIHLRLWIIFISFVCKLNKEHFSRLLRLLNTGSWLKKLTASLCNGNQHVDSSFVVNVNRSLANLVVRHQSVILVLRVPKTRTVGARPNKLMSGGVGRRMVN